MTASSRAECKRLRLGAACGATDIGLVREANEDSFLLDDALSLLIVADGMGGHVAGAMASAEAIVAMQSFLRTWLDRATGADAGATVPHEGMGARMACGGGGAGLSPCRQDQAAHALRAAVESANAQVFGINVAHRHAQGERVDRELRLRFEPGGECRERLHEAAAEDAVA